VKRRQALPEGNLPINSRLETHRSRFNGESAKVWRGRHPYRHSGRRLRPLHSARPRRCAGELVQAGHLLIYAWVISWFMRELSPV